MCFLSLHTHAKAYLYFYWLYWMVHLNNHNNPSVTAGLVDMLLGCESEVCGFNAKRDILLDFCLLQGLNIAKVLQLLWVFFMLLHNK